MKRIVTLFAAAMFIIGSATAQTSDTQTGEKTSFGDKISKFWKKVKNEVSYTADGIFSKSDNDLSLVDGSYYMQVYDVNLYKDASADAMCNICRASFVEQYPNAEVKSCVIPQTDWLSTPIKEDGSVVGYVQTMYCYVLAQDGTDGYINSKYVFVRAKEVGREYVADNDSWGKHLRTDVLTNAVYAELTKVKTDE